MTERATLEETLAFCNKVREAGGGAILDALMPATPTDPRQCLIAKNLNFQCNVQGGYGENRVEWGMNLDSTELAEQIATAVGLELDPYRPNIIILPREIGAVAAAFDEVWDEDLQELGTWYFDYQAEINCGTYTDSFSSYLIEADVQIEDRVFEFLPYIEQSLKESSELGVFNEKGELIL